MKTISITEFKSLITSNDWIRTQKVSEVDTHSRIIREYMDYNENYCVEEVTNHWGYATVTSTLGEVTIEFQEAFSYDECDQESILTSNDGLEHVWVIDGVEVIDDDGEKICNSVLSDYLGSDFSKIDYSVLDIEQITDVDVNKCSEMESFTVYVDNQPNIRFNGELVASAQSSDNNAMASSYSGSPGCWTELNLYLTAGGKYVCHKIERTKWVGSRDHHSAVVCDNVGDVIKFFGHGWLAKELYDTAGIDAAEIVS